MEQPLERSVLLFCNSLVLTMFIVIGLDSLEVGIVLLFSFSVGVVKEPFSLRCQGVAGGEA